MRFLLRFMIYTRIGSTNITENMPLPLKTSTDYRSLTLTTNRFNPSMQDLNKRTPLTSLSSWTSLAKSSSELILGLFRTNLLTPKQKLSFLVLMCPMELIGELKEQSQELRIKGSVVHAGLSQLSAVLKVFLKLEMETFRNSVNNSWLIAQAEANGEIKDATEVQWQTLWTTLKLLAWSARLLILIRLLHKPARLQQAVSKSLDISLLLMATAMDYQPLQAKVQLELLLMLRTSSSMAAVSLPIAKLDWTTVLH